ncbi:MAG: AAA family ATPase [Deltaproteobacteria bacterium]|nr:AAA family ATPase [Deltaproteobacteria bacterium]
MAGERETGAAGAAPSPATVGPTTAASLETRRLVEALLDPAAGRLSDGPIRLVETHISYILLTGRLAYKIKKPLRLDFLDFSTLEQRRRACEDELRLNRRTAPELYLRVVAITGTPEAPRLGTTSPPTAAPERDANARAVAQGGAPIEYAVEMRQFDPDALLESLVEAGTIDADLVDALAERVAAFHASLPPVRRLEPASKPDPAPGVRDRDSGSTAIAAIPTAIPTARRNLAEILGLALEPTLRERIDSLAQWLEASAVELAPFLAARARAGFVRECHGDLHLANVAVIDGRPVLFDCLEFDVALRTIDVLDEVAFAFVDFVAHDRRDLAHRFLNAYLEATGDYAGVAGLHFHALHRALVRAKVALLRARQPGLDAAARARVAADVERHVVAAESQARPPRARLVITCGLAGSGKTTVSGALVEALGAVRIRSDVERKRLAGLEARARSASPIGGGLYDREGSARTYAQLESLARSLLAAAQSVVVDAAFLDRSDRDRFRALAKETGVDFAIALCEAPVEVLRGRIAARLAAGRDASEADAAVLEHQLERYAPPAGEELAAVVPIATDRGVEAVREACRAFARR